MKGDQFYIEEFLVGVGLGPGAWGLRGLCPVAEDPGSKPGPVALGGGGNGSRSWVSDTHVGFLASNFGLPALAVVGICGVSL